MDQSISPSTSSTAPETKPDARVGALPRRGQWATGRGRALQTPADVAATVAFALDNRAITGTTLLVDGGQHLMRFERDFSLM